MECNGGSALRPCLPGFFKPQCGEHRCERCSVGWFAPFIGACKCQICPKGFTSNPGCTGCGASYPAWPSLKLAVVPRNLHCGLLFDSGLQHAPIASNTQQGGCKHVTDFVHVHLAMACTLLLTTCAKFGMLGTC